MLKGNWSSTKFEDIHSSINSVTDTMDHMADVVAKKKKEIFDILKNNLAETADDEKCLEDLKDALLTKKADFEANLWRSSDKIDLSDNKDLITFWKNKINWVDTSPKASDPEKLEIKDRVDKTLIKIQKLDYANKSRTLFGGKTFDVTKISENIKVPEIGEILNATTEAGIEAKIDNFINGVSKTKNPFHIQHSKLYITPDTQRKVSLRIVLFAYILNKMIDDGSITSAQCKKVKDILDKQIIQLETQKIRWIYNVKKELEAVEPEYETLRDINTKDVWDIDLGTEKYETAPRSIGQDLTPEFEHGLATDLDRYVLDVAKITTDKWHPIKMKDMSGEKPSISVEQWKSKDIELQIEVWSQQITLWKLSLNNKDLIWDAKFIFEMSAWSEISSKLSTAEIAANFPLEIKFGLQGIKKVKKWNVGLTRNLVVKLEESDWWGPIPHPKPGEAIANNDMDITFSDMSGVINEKAWDKAYDQEAADFAKSRSKWRLNRVWTGVKYSLFGEIIGRNRKRKEKKVINSTKAGLSLLDGRADVADIHSNKTEDMKLVETLWAGNYPNLYPAMTELTYEYYNSTSTTTKAEFHRQLLDFFNPNMVADYDQRTELENLLWVLKRWKIDINSYAWNIIKMCDVKKWQNALKKAVNDAIEFRGWDTDDQVKSKIETAFKNFYTEYKSIPEIFSNFNNHSTVSATDKVNINDSYNQIATKFMAHFGAIQDINYASINDRAEMNIKFYRKWKAIDHVNANKQSATWRNPLLKWSELLNKWTENKVRWSPTRYLVKAATTIGVTAGTAALLSTWWWIAAGAVWVWSLAAWHKSKQMQKKLESQEKDYIKNRTAYSAEWNADDRLKIMDKYLSTFGNLDNIKTQMDILLAKPGLTPTEKDNLFDLVSLIYAWLDYQKKTWHQWFSIAGWLTTQEKNRWITNDIKYNKAMSELYKYRDVWLQKLHLQDSAIDKDYIMAESDYIRYKSWYMWDFSKFKTAFGKHRRWETTKTFATTWAIYGVAWLASWWAHELINRINNPSTTNNITAVAWSPGISSSWNLTESCNLWQWNVDTGLQSDLHSIITTNNPWTTYNMTIGYHAGVDATAAKVWAFSNTMLNTEINNIQTLVNSGGFSWSTQSSVLSNLSPANIQQMQDFANAAWADAGNQNLFVLRNLENIKATLNEIKGNTNINATFNFDDTNSVIWNTVHTASDRFASADINIQVAPVKPVVPLPTPPVRNTNDAWAWQWIYNEDHIHKKI